MTGASEDGASSSDEAMGAATFRWLRLRSRESQQSAAAGRRLVPPKVGTRLRFPPSAGTSVIVISGTLEGGSRTRPIAGAATPKESLRLLWRNRCRTVAATVTIARQRPGQAQASSVRLKSDLAFESQVSIADL